MRIIDRHSLIWAVAWQKPVRDGAVLETGK